MKVTKQETLYQEDYGATLKHKCGKKDSNIVPSLFFSHFFLFSFFWWASLASFIFYFIRPESHPDLWGNHSLHHPFLTWDNALIMMIITLLLITTHKLQVQTRTRYDSI